MSEYAKTWEFEGEPRPKADLGICPVCGVNHRLPVCITQEDPVFLCVSNLKNQLSSCQKELAEVQRRYEAMLAIWRNTSVELAEARKEIERLKNELRSEIELKGWNI